jgi:hypothetical protein
LFDIQFIWNSKPIKLTLPRPLSLGKREGSEVTSNLSRSPSPPLYSIDYKLKKQTLNECLILIPRIERGLGGESIFPKISYICFH